MSFNPGWEMEFLVVGVIIVVAIIFVHGWNAVTIAKCEHDKQQLKKMKEGNYAREQDERTDREDQRPEQRRRSS